MRAHIRMLAARPDLHAKSLSDEGRALLQRGCADDDVIQLTSRHGSSFFRDTSPSAGNDE
jgi:hypothetical protein